MSSFLQLDATDFDVVATALNRRVEAMGITQGDLADRADLSVQVVRSLQRGEVRRYHPDTLFKMSRAVGWPSTAMVRLLAGLPPTSVPGSSAAAA